MNRLAIAILVVVACGGTSKPSTTGGGGVYAKKLVVTWGIEPRGSSADVFLQTTDETGKQVSYPVGTYEGTCKVFQPTQDMRAVSGVQCTVGESGTQLHAVVNAGEIIVLKLHIATGVASDPMAREEVTRVRAPGGAAIEAGS